jgi:hypothetical protein
MVYNVAAAYGFTSGAGVDHRSLLEGKARIRRVRIDVFALPCREVVENPHVMALVD